jgi:molybdenum cofactor cytidylyltransferase
MGRPKALARVRGVSLIESTVRLLAPLAASKIIVVTPPRALSIRIELRHHRIVFVENPRRTMGLSTSVRCGLRRARYGPAVLLLPLDLARLRRRDLVRLIARWSAARRRLVARRVGDHGGTPVILPRWLCSRALAISGDMGLREFLSHLPRKDLALVDLPSADFDVDTPRDLELARRRGPLET